MKVRIDYFDFLRGIAILFVIIIHSYSGDPLAGTFLEDLYLVLRQLVTCAVPLFLAMSGYFLATKMLTTRKEYYEFFAGHSFRIWLPMVVWSIPLYIIKDHNNYVTSFILLMMGGYSIYYYITLTIQYYAMQPLLKKVNMGGVILSLVITLIAVALDNYFIAIKGYNIPMLVECGPFWMWLVYPALGYYIRKNGRNYMLTPWLILMVLFLGACFIETKLLYGPFHEGDGATKVSAVLYSCCAILVLFSEKTQDILEKDNIIYHGLVYVGKISFGIYLIHKYFLDYFVKGFVEDTLLRTLITLIICIAFIYISKRLFPRVSERFLGFK